MMSHSTSKMEMVQVAFDISLAKIAVKIVEIQDDRLRPQPI